MKGFKKSGVLIWIQDTGALAVKPPTKRDPPIYGDQQYDSYKDQSKPAVHQPLNPFKGALKPPSKEPRFLETAISGPIFISISVSVRISISPFTGAPNACLRV